MALHGVCCFPNIKALTCLVIACEMRPVNLLLCASKNLIANGVQLEEK
jgi:hypothetical protein